MHAQREYKNNDKFSVQDKYVQLDEAKIRTSIASRMSLVPDPLERSAKVFQLDLSCVELYIVHELVVCLRLYHIAGDLRRWYFPDTY